MPSANPPKHRSAPPRHRLDTWRRAGSLVLAVLCFLAVPQVAQALFTARQAPAGTSVSVARVVAPSAVVGNWSCSTSGLFQESVTVNVTGFADANQLPGVSYTLRVWKTGTSGGETVTLASKKGTATARQVIDLGATDYSVQITAVRNNWSQVWQDEVTCNLGNTNSGNLG